METRQSSNSGRCRRRSTATCDLPVQSPSTPSKDSGQSSSSASEGDRLIVTPNSADNGCVSEVCKRSVYRDVDFNKSTSKKSEEDRAKKRTTSSMGEVMGKPSLRSSSRRGSSPELGLGIVLGSKDSSESSSSASDGDSDSGCLSSESKMSMGCGITFKKRMKSLRHRTDFKDTETYLPSVMENVGGSSSDESQADTSDS